MKQSITEDKLPEEYKVIMNNLDGSLCPFCGDGTLNRGFNDVEYQYKGHTLLIQQPGTYCDLCHESILEPSDLKSNRRDLQAFRSRVDGLLEPKKIKSARKALGLNQKDAVEEYCMDKLHLEQELEEQEWKLENLLVEVKDLKSDIEYTKEQLEKLCLEDYYCE